MVGGQSKLARKVLITGGTGDIGTALVERFAQIGDDVCFLFKDNKIKANKIIRNYKVNGIQIDLVGDFVLPKMEVDILINNAAVNYTSEPTGDVQIDDWQTTIKINLIAPIKLSLLYLPIMKKNKFGRIINISSIYGLRGSENNGPYNVSKHGLSGLTKSIAKDYGRYGITANEICPGPVQSSLLKRVAIGHGAKTPTDITAYFEELAEEIPLEKLAKPQDVAECAAFLASDHAAYINGISIPIDGGLIA